jgi:hypothetical protein
MHAITGPITAASANGKGASPMILDRRAPLERTRWDNKSIDQAGPDDAKHRQRGRSAERRFTSDQLNQQFRARGRRRRPRPHSPQEGEAQPGGGEP